MHNFTKWLISVVAIVGIISGGTMAWKGLYNLQAETNDNLTAAKWNKLVKQVETINTRLGLIYEADGETISIKRGEADLPGLSCKHILNDGGSIGDGEYWIQPVGISDAFKVYCDMTTDGGGWTLMIFLDTNDGNSDIKDANNVWWQAQGEKGILSPNLQGDYLSQSTYIPFDNETKMMLRADKNRDITLNDNEYVLLDGCINAGKLHNELVKTNVGGDDKLICSNIYNKSLNATDSGHIFYGVEYIRTNSAHVSSGENGGKIWLKSQGSNTYAMGFGSHSHGQTSNMNSVYNCDFGQGNTTCIGDARAANTTNYNVGYQYPSLWIR